MTIPTEHGGWGLTLEPIVLGLLVAPSGAGVAIGLAAMVAFVARTPVKVVLVDRWRHRWLSRTRLAAVVAVVELLVLVLLLGLAERTAQGPFWGPLAIAAPLIGLELWFDMRSRSRRLLPELAGTIGIGSVAAAIVLAGNGQATIAAGAWVLIAARALASLPFVRYQLSRAKSHPNSRRAQDIAQGAAAALAGLAWTVGWLSAAAFAALAALCGIQLVSARTPAPRAAIAGTQQLTLGLGLVIIAGLTMT